MAGRARRGKLWQVQAVQPQAIVWCNSTYMRPKDVASAHPEGRVVDGGDKLEILGSVIAHLWGGAREAVLGSIMKQERLPQTGDHYACNNCQCAAVCCSVLLATQPRSTAGTWWRALGRTANVELMLSFVSTTLPSWQGASKGRETNSG